MVRRVKRIFRPTMISRSCAASALGYTHKIRSILTYSLRSKTAWLLARLTDTAVPTETFSLTYMESQRHLLLCCRDSTRTQQKPYTTMPTKPDFCDYIENDAPSSAIVAVLPRSKDAALAVSSINKVNTNIWLWHIISHLWRRMIKCVTTHQNDIVQCQYPQSTLDAWLDL